ncbi:MAG: hypothetical protein BM564_11340 [Bacteroidetes bacterium MedPE-SWsnd-G2]|nr:MAG: hypothetical protein BM564_11340 [Bacteroidetes bacterium MedPE-SWsnd-G2]
MDANVVYSVAKALPKEELDRLYRMLKSELYPVKKESKAKEIAPDFTDEDALEYLFKTLKIE